MEGAQVACDDSGHFAIAGDDMHDIQLAAEEAGLGRSARLRVRPYFRAREVVLAEPLQLVPGS